MAYPTAVVVVHSFGVYNRGDLITDSAEITQLYQNEQHAWVVPTSWEAPAAPAESSTVSGGAS